MDIVDGCDVEQDEAVAVDEEEEEGNDGGTFCFAHSVNLSWKSLFVSTWSSLAVVDVDMAMRGK